MKYLSKMCKKYSAYKLNALLIRSVKWFPSYCYSIVPNLDEDDSPEYKTDTSDSTDLNDIKLMQSIQSPKKVVQNANNNAFGSLKCLQSNPEDDEIGDGLRTTTTVQQSIVDTNDLSQQTYPPFTAGKVERRRRKLPEIPKNKRCKPSIV